MILNYIIVGWFSVFFQDIILLTAFSVFDHNVIDSLFADFIYQSFVGIICPHLDYEILSWCHYLNVPRLCQNVQLFVHHVFYAWLITAFGLEISSFSPSCLMFGLWFLLIRSTFNMYRPLQCVCYMRKPLISKRIRGCFPLLLVCTVFKIVFFCQSTCLT